MTEAELRSYRFLCQEIQDLNRRIKKELNRPVKVVPGKVKASMPEFPFTEIHVGVEMEEPAAAAARDRLLRLYQEQLAKAEQKKLEIEDFIRKIEEPELRLIFRYRYLDGMKLADLGDKLGIDRSWIGKRVRTYLQEKSPQSPF